MNKIRYVYAGEMFGERCYMEEGMKWNWTTKISMFFMKVLPRVLNLEAKQDG